MKRFFAFTLIVAVIGNWISPYVPYIDYYVNQDFIARELCENKDKPELNCKGKCHLDKEIKKTVQKENSPQSPFSPSQKQIKHGDFFCKNLKKNNTLVSHNSILFKPYMMIWSNHSKDIPVPPPELFVA